MLCHCARLAIRNALSLRAKRGNLLSPPEILTLHFVPLRMTAGGKRHTECPPVIASEARQSKKSFPKGEKR